MLRLFVFLLCSGFAAASFAADAPSIYQQAEALVREAERQFGRDNEAAAEATIEKARALVRANPDLDAELLMHSVECWFAFGKRSPQEVQQLAEAALALPELQTRPRWFADLRLCRGYTLELQAQLDAAMADYDFAVSEGRRLQQARLLADATWTRGELRSFRGQFADALSDLKEAYSLYRQLDDSPYGRDVLRAIATLYSRIGEHDQALHYLKQLRAIAEQEGLTSLAASMEADMGHAFSRQGDHVNALDHYQRALKLAEGRQEPEQIAIMQQSIGAELVSLQRAAEALPYLDRALAERSKLTDPIQRALTHAYRAGALQQLQRPDEAIAAYERAIPVFIEHNALRYLVDARRGYADALAARQQWQAAYRTLQLYVTDHQKLDQQLREEQTTRSRVQFDTERKEQENNQLEKEKNLTSQALADAQRIRTLQSLVIALAVVLLAILTYLGWKQLKASRRMRDLAMTDELTRLPNRRHILSYATEQIDLARAQKQSLSVLVFDIDYFKRVNDTYGHAVGDVVLQRIAHACQHVLRSEDKLGRTGGEEFLVVLPGAKAAIALEVAERLRRAVEEIDCSDLHADLRIAISIGVCEWQPAIPDIAQLSRHADDALYKAKGNGRNRTELAEPVF